MKDDGLKKALIESLLGKNAHANLEESIQGVKPEFRNKKPTGELHTIWQQLEHIRIAQEDILKYMIDPDWKSPKWPDEYWPADGGNISDDKWNDSIKKLNSDLNEIITLVKNPDLDLSSALPHSARHTYIREILLIIDHNSYHTGQIVETRKLLGDW